MRIAYLASYIGRDYSERYLNGKNYALSGPFKIRGIARALLSLGHEVTVYSPGLTVANRIIRPFEEKEFFPEGVLTIKYSKCFSYPKCSPINDWLISRMIKKDADQYDVFIYYNISSKAAMSISAFRDSIKVLEYEDNVFNRALKGDKLSMERYKHKLYNYLINHTDGVMAVCLGLQLKDKLKYSVLTPGIINEEVIDNVSSRENKIEEGLPVRIILTGGIHYSKGGDLLVKAMSFIDSPCIVTVYGNCSLDESLKELIKLVPQRHEFHFNGYMEHSNLIETLDREADILINTTRSMGVGAQAAGFPFKMMEYAATGRPIISSEIGKLDDEYNRHITYYDGEDPRNIATAIEEVISHYDEKVRLALELQKIVLNKYSISGVGKQLDSFFKTITSTNNG